VTAAWKKCAQLALRRVVSARGTHVSEVRHTLNQLIDEYIEKLSVLRNKMAHGQVVVALNRGNTEINEALSEEIRALNVVVLDSTRSLVRALPILSRGSLSRRN
jgi:hypothetical protein